MAIGDKKLLIVCGCPRSGTTELTALLNAHHDICLGVERYLYLYSSDEPNLSPDLFVPDRFEHVSPGESFVTDLNDMPGWGSGTGDLNMTKFRRAGIVGDKAPDAVFYIEAIARKLPVDRFLITLRDIISVCRSYDTRSKRQFDTLWRREDDFSKGVEIWSSVTVAVSEYLERGVPASVVFMPHLYRDGSDGLDSLLATIGARPDAGIQKYFDASVSYRQSSKSDVPETPKQPTPAELDIIMQSAYVREAYRKFSQSPIRIDVDELFWRGFGDLARAQWNLT